MKLTSSLEDYLKTIHILEQEKPVVRVIDISSMMDVRMPSVIEALKNLREIGLVNYQKKAFINLTDKGKKIAESILSRHMILMRFFAEVLGLDDSWIKNQACMIEHSIDNETTVRLSGLIDWIERTVINQPEFSREDWTRLLKKSDIIH